MNLIFDYIEAAGHGTLPRAQHHPHSAKEPLQGIITHFSLGWGISSFVYVWVALWALYCAVFAGKFFLNQERANVEAVRMAVKSG